MSNVNDDSGSGKNKTIIPIGRSNRHAHLTQENIDRLFGKGYKLTFLRNIRQHDEFVSGESIDVIGPNGVLTNVRILGPEREAAQVEMSITDARRIGVKAAVRLSGDVSGSGEITLAGPKGEIRLSEGAITAKRHIHANPDEAKALGLEAGMEVAVMVGGARSITFQHVVVRIDAEYSLEMHLDADEYNAAGAEPGVYGELIHKREGLK